MGLRFDGEFGDLQRLVRDLKCKGEWKEVQNGAQFRSKDGAIINWFQTTGTINVQGPEPAKTRMRDRLRSILEDGDMEAVEAAPAAVEVREAVVAPVRARKKAAREEKRVFVVHGHDDVAREQLELVLRRLDLDPFVLVNTGGGGLTIIEALEKEAGTGPGRCRFGIVLLTPDDVGYAKKDGDKNAQPRARQNVVLEMGMLMAALGRANVAILKKGHLEEPSDVKGIIYLPFNEHVKETVPKLVDRLREAGFELNPRAISVASV